MVRPTVSRSVRRTSLVAGFLASAVLINAGVASAGTPSITGTQATHITSTNATLEAEIDPQGAPAGVFYQFQLLLDPGEAPTEIVCPSSVPGYSGCEGPQGPGALPIEWISGSGPQTVTLDLSGAGVTLDPGRNYYFRVLAADRVFTEDTVKWEAPASAGPTEEFTTPAPPSIVSESASNITQTNATLNAEINLHEAPNGVYYQFQLVTDPSEFALEILCPPTLQPGYSGCIGPQGTGVLPIGFLPGNTLQPGATLGASLDLASAGVTLQPGTTYHYRALAARAVQTEDTIEWESPVYGADQTFTTTSPSLTVGPSSCPFSAGSPACPSGPPNPAPSCKKSQLERHGKCVRGRHCRHHKRKHHRKHIRGGHLCKR